MTVLATNARSSHVVAESVADCPFSMAQEYAAEFMRSAEHLGVEGSIGVTPPFQLPSIRRNVTLTFGIVNDITEYGREHDEVLITWKSGTPTLPDFRGSVRFRIDGLMTRVTVGGDYAPPLGVLGAIFDRLIGRTIARASIQDLANRIAAHLTDRECRWRACHAVDGAGSMQT